MSKKILITSLADVKLEPAPINPSWIISGEPQTSWKEIAASKDKTTFKGFWTCTPGLFKWNYRDDETLHMISGEAFLTLEDGKEHRIGAGDVVYFPAGSSCIWRITEPVQKFAIVRRALPYPIGLIVRAFSKLGRIIKRDERPWG